MTPAHDEPLEEQAARAQTNSGYAQNGTLFPQVYRAAAPPVASKNTHSMVFFSEEQEWELLSYDRWDPNKKAERQKCLDWDETIADALRKEFGLVQHGSESFKEALERKLMEAFVPTRNGPKHDFSVFAVQVAAVVKSAMQKSMEELTEEEQRHVSKCLREMLVNHPLMKAKLKNLPRDSFPEHPGKLLMKLGEMGKQFWDGSALFADYALLLKPVQDALEEKDRQIKYWKDKAGKKDQPNDKTTNDHEAGPSGHDKDKRRERRKINPSITCHNCGEKGHIASNCTGKRAPQQGTMQPPPPRTPATTAASSVSAHRQTGISRKPGFPRVSPRMPALDYKMKAWPPTSLY